MRLTMRLSDAGLRRRPTKLIYPNHQLPPWLTEDATRDRSNRLLVVNCDHANIPGAGDDVPQLRFSAGHYLRDR
jgi:hypothetical protein